VAIVLVTETAAVVLQLSAVIRREDGLWVAGCPSLDVFSQGHSEEDAKSNLHEAVELWIDSCLERNTLAAALRELGWYRIPPGTLPKSGNAVGIMRRQEEFPASLGEEYPLEVTIPAYQAALLSDAPQRAHS
jgi:predicted RNase H-like HicB family nuclease